MDNKFFSNIFKLNINDIIKIYDLNGNKLEYTIYSVKEINPDDFSCTSQKTNNKKEITLITCNNINGKRLCIKASE